MGAFMIINPTQTSAYTSHTLSLLSTSIVYQSADADACSSLRIVLFVRGYSLQRTTVRAGADGADAPANAAAAGDLEAGTAAAAIDKKEGAEDASEGEEQRGRESTEKQRDAEDAATTVGDGETRKDKDSASADADADEEKGEEIRDEAR